MKDVISFSVPGSTSIHDLQLGNTLVRFAEYDLKYFREECAQIYEQHISAGEDALEKALAFKEYIRNCHPYCSARLHTEFDQIALDCIIDTICTTQAVGLEELWVKNLTSKDRFGQALFSRITEYKTGYAINQWKNLQRMQTYALSKLEVIYGGPDTDISVHKARKLYYDTAFRMIAAELGFESEDLPNVRISSVPFLPESIAMMKNAVNTLEPIVHSKLKGIEAREPLKGRACVQDQMAGMALNLMINIKRPELEEIRQMIQTYGALPNSVYEPSSFKAVIDLEFDQLLERGYYLRAEQNNYSRFKYSGRKDTATEKTALRPEAPDPAAVIKSPEPEKRPAKEKTAAAAPKQTQHKAAEHIEAADPLPVTEKPGSNIANIPAELSARQGGNVKTIIEMAKSPARKESKERTLQEVNTRCNLIWTSMNVRTGWSITAEDASEWFRYLTKLRYGINTGELTPEALDKFLDATLEVYKLLPENA